MQIFIKIIEEGKKEKTLPLNVEPNDEVYTLQGKIQDYTGISPSTQRLYFEGKQLEDEKKILADYNIQNESTILLEIELFRAHCYVIYGKGKKIKIGNYCPCCCNTLSLKSLIKKKLGIDIKYQELKVDGKIINDNESLESNGVDNGKEVELNIKICPDEFMKLTESK